MPLSFGALSKIVRYAKRNPGRTHSPRKKADESQLPLEYIYLAWDGVSINFREGFVKSGADAALDVIRTLLTSMYPWIIQLGPGARWTVLDEWRWASGSSSSKAPAKMSTQGYIPVIKSEERPARIAGGIFTFLNNEASYSSFITDFSQSVKNNLTERRSLPPTFERLVHLFAGKILWTDRSPSHSLIVLMTNDVERLSMNEHKWKELKDLGENVVILTGRSGGMIDDDLDVTVIQIKGLFKEPDDVLPYRVRRFSA
ncbi:hypothetical protein M231_03587 [Tremella mesenterica]|uniref:Uncharacterized protein n=1 Tax=Tremella mesenterica TaxID=5217 RepID=A0A4Q1BN32_TREME|nr:hypothetical protein M231_03587 [Tremella mesenterica]